MLLSVSFYELMAPLFSPEPCNFFVHNFVDWILLHSLLFQECEGITESIRRQPVQLSTRSEA